MGLTRAALQLFFDLVELGATSPLGALSINELCATTKDDGSLPYCASMPYSTVYNYLTKMQELGYVAFGPKDKSAYTYYLTKKGMQYYEDNLA